MKYLLLIMMALASAADELSIERLLASPSLHGVTVNQINVVPHSERISFLQNRRDDATQFDLWWWQPNGSAQRVLQAEQVLTNATHSVSPAELAARERKRQFGRGISDYAWHPDGKQLLLPVGGRLFLVNASNAEALTWREIGDGSGGIHNAKFSPQGRYVSFVRQQNLFIADVAQLRIRALTLDGAGAISYGSAEFIAGEELGRHDGYWWAPNDQYLAYARVDESAVTIQRRYDMRADDVVLVEQRYPQAGGKNAVVQLIVTDLLSDTTTAVEWTDNDDVYLARVAWLPDARRLAVQRLARDQRNLDLLLVDTITGKAKRVINENNKYWVNLNNDAKFLARNNQILWASQRTGFKHLYLYQHDGKQLQALTTGAWEVSSVCAVNEQEGVVYFTANKDSVLENQLYAVKLSGGEITRISTEAGWHQPFCHAQDNRTLIVDQFSHTRQMPRTQLLSTNGQTQLIVANEPQAEHPYAPFWSQHIAPEFGQIKADDGQVLHYALYKPRGFDAGKKYPVVFDIYGGPHAQRVRNAFLLDWKQVLLQNGFIVVTLDNRGMANRGLDFEQAIYHRMGNPEVRDQQAMVTQLRQWPFVDAQHIGVFGWSYGGYMALNLLCKAAADFSAAIAVAPVTDWRLYDTAYTERYMGHPTLTADAYQDSSVLSHVAGCNGKLLLMHGMADDNVLFLHSVKLMAALQQHNKPFELMTYPGSKHSISGVPERTHLYNSALEFLQRHLRASAGVQPSPSP